MGSFWGAGVGALDLGGVLVLIYNHDGETTLCIHLVNLQKPLHPMIIPKSTDAGVVVLWLVAVSELS